MLFNDETNTAILMTFLVLKCTANICFLKNQKPNKVMSQSAIFYIISGFNNAFTTFENLKLFLLKYCHFKHKFNDLFSPKVI